MKNANQLIGCCGLDCETCDARIATITNDNALREKTAALWTKLNGVTITPEMINCTGCRVDGAKTPFCDKLCPVHNCVREKGLDGAADWSQYSWGSCSLIYDSDIAERLCCPSELKKTRNGERRPNSREEWLDVQARALRQAANRVCRHIRSLERSGVIS